MEAETQALMGEVYEILAYSDGSLTRSEAFVMSARERRIIADKIKEREKAKAALITGQQPS